MRKDERIAEGFLNSLQLGEVRYEPDGNIPPDFCVRAKIGAKIGVEVRRLNQNYLLPDGSKEGFEDIVAGAWKRMDKMLKALGPSISGECWNVVMEFRRPLDWKILTSEIVVRLTEFQRMTVREDITLRFGDNFELDLIRARRDAGSFFNLMGSANADAGGSVMALVEQNLRLCVAEKESKVAPFRHKYDEWWLVLINRIDLHMEAEDYVNFRANVTPPIVHSFDRVFLVDPWDHSNSFEF